MQDRAFLESVIALTGASLLDVIKELPPVAATPGAYEAIVRAGQIAYTLAYRYVYYVSVGELLPMPDVDLKKIIADNPKHLEASQSLRHAS